MNEVFGNFVCVFCDKNPSNPPFYNCKSGHLVCGACYAVLLHRNTVAVENALICKVCQAEVTDTRNLLAEKMVKEEFRSNVYNGPDMSTTSSVFSMNPHRYDSHSPFSRLHSSSKRPIRCPECKCNRMVAVTSINSHFQYEHPRVIRNPIRIGETEQFILWPECLEEPYYLIALLNVVEHLKTSELGKSASHGKTESSMLSVALLCSKIKFPTVARSVNSNLSKPGLISSGDCPSTSHQVITFDKSEPNYVDNLNEFMIFWASGISIENKNLSVSIEIANMSNKLAFSYRGPLNSLRDDQEPCKVFCRGKCLLIQMVVLSRLLNVQEEFIINMTINNS